MPIAILRLPEPTLPAGPPTTAPATETWADNAWAWATDLTAHLPGGTTALIGWTLVAAFFAVLGARLAVKQ